MGIKNRLIWSRTQDAVEVFHSTFAFFADFKNFNQPAIQEGAVCSRCLYGTNSGSTPALEFRRDKFQLAQVLMAIFRFFSEFRRFC